MFFWIIEIKLNTYTKRFIFWYSFERSSLVLGSLKSFLRRYFFCFSSNLHLLNFRRNILFYLSLFWLDFAFFEKSCREHLIVFLILSGVFFNLQFYLSLLYCLHLLGCSSFTTPAFDKFTFFSYFILLTNFHKLSE